ncbi:MAG: PQQ-binding-like beta-propeller repeat protein [Planctomycetes bacterium]|nr:PQQ-binding-like beta-propeller repeat protein [Planctomycetota bacterium]
MNAGRSPRIYISEKTAAALRPVALISLIFSVAVGGMLAWNSRENYAEELRFNEKLPELRQAIADDPANIKLREELRQLDFEIRKRYFDQKTSRTNGAVLLAIGLLVFFGCIKLLNSQRPNPPRPGSRQPDALGADFRYGKFIVCACSVIAVSYLGYASSKTGAEYPTYAQAEVVEDWASESEMNENWPRFRGPQGIGVAKGENYPTSWDGESGQNIIWKIEVPLRGENSPIVWQDRLFISGANKERKTVFCYAIDNGQLLWETDINIKGSPTETPNVWDEGTLSACTMATDGARVFVMFANGDLAALDMDGRVIWGKAFGIPENSYGHASSLITAGDRLIVQMDQGSGAEDGLSFIYAFNSQNGRQVWKTAREVPNSWTTPILLNANDKNEIVTLANPWLIAYSPEDGKEIWKAKVTEGEVAPSPAYAKGTVIACNEGFPIVAVKAGGTGDVTDTNILWQADEGSPNISSPLATDKLVILGDSSGMVNSYDIKTGKKLWEFEADNAFQSSPTLAGNMIYLMDEDGIMHIFAHTDNPESLGGKWHTTSKLGEKSNCSPAFHEGRIYIRGRKHLFCIGRKE